ncbi:MAG: hypothetical protein ACOY0S_03800 [Patescibacteria group bacterium]
MPNPGSIVGQITEELGELGKKVVTETAKVPKDIASRALESLESSPITEESAKAGPWEKFDELKDEEVKRAMARAALAQLAGKPRPKEPPIVERLEQEEREKKEAAAKQAAVAAQMAPIAVPRGRRRGDLYSLSAKASSEKSRNVRQD